MTEFFDQEIKCRCGVIFYWTVGEQKFMETLLANGKIPHIVPPKRCPECRLKRRNQFKNHE